MTPINTAWLRRYADVSIRPGAFLVRIYPEFCGIGMI